MPNRSCTSVQPVNLAKNPQSHSRSTKAKALHDALVMGRNHATSWAQLDPATAQVRPRDTGTTTPEQLQETTLTQLETRLLVAYRRMDLRRKQENLQLLEKDAEKHPVIKRQAVSSNIRLAAVCGKLVSA